jgi:hypothetical protein
MARVSARIHYFPLWNTMSFQSARLSRDGACCDGACVLLTLGPRLRSVGSRALISRRVSCRIAKTARM